MAHRKLFLRYPPEYQADPKVLHLRQEAVEEFLESKHSNAISQSSWWPTAALIIVNLFGVLGLLSPEKVVEWSRLLSH